MAIYRRRRPSILAVRLFLNISLLIDDDLVKLPSSLLGAGPMGKRTGVSLSWLPDKHGRIGQVAENGASLRLKPSPNWAFRVVN
ncbi:hypothetical protein SLEP1_g50254 [Rubroshorea leprosula]|uniref:Uncharacterized protein n=1 Tax=Rubroshorea leprosula TaxID=152421 RepID=A0AAV5LZC8_9ROSI|nr:hypothetical protein SLEP1_g50254 [Rubroshorea leprosula]